MRILITTNNMCDSFLKENIYFIFSHVYVCMSLDVNCSCLQRPGVTDPKGAGVMGGYEWVLPCTGITSVWYYAQLFLGVSGVLGIDLRSSCPILWLYIVYAV